MSIESNSSSRNELYMDSFKIMIKQIYKLSQIEKKRTKFDSMFFMIVKIENLYQISLSNISFN